MGEVGAGINALKGYQSNMFSYASNTDAGLQEYLMIFTKESSILAQSSILNQSALSMVSQANRAQANLLTPIRLMGNNTLINIIKTKIKGEKNDIC